MHSTNSLRKISLNYIIALIPFILYGFYKNGILLYLNYQSNALTLLKPLLFVLASFLIGILIDKYYLKNDISNSITIPLCIITSLIIPINTNIFLFIGILIIALLLSKYININYIIFTKLIIILIMYLMGDYTYLNNFELNNIVKYTTIDLLAGRSIGGLACTSSIIGIISYLFLYNCNIYKRNIPIYIISSYIITSIIFIPFIGFNLVFNNFLNSTIIFISIFIASLPIYSPITKKDTIIYSIIIGLIGSILVNTISVFEGIYLAILLSTLIIYLKNKLIKTK